MIKVYLKFFTVPECVGEQGMCSALVRCKTGVRRTHGSAPVPFSSERKAPAKKKPTQKSHKEVVWGKNSCFLQAENVWAVLEQTQAAWEPPNRGTAPRGKEF